MARIIKALAAVALLAIAFVAAVPAEDEVTSIPDYGPLKSKYYSGYLNATNERKAFYMFVESTSDPATAPLVLWLNGGPGCSSLMGMFEENGPYTMRHGGQFVANDYNWSQLANILYIESPGGVGFSIDTTPATSWTDDLAASFNFAALQSFFKKFPEYTSHKFFITGESYAGFYVPELAYTIFQSNDSQLKANMQGFMVGNPCTGQYGCCNPDPFLNDYLRYNGFLPMAWGFDTVQDPNAQYDHYDLLVPTCETTAAFSRVQFKHPVLDALRRRVAKLGNPPAPYGPCADNYVTTWLNRPDVQTAIHAQVGINWMSCNPNIIYTCNLDGVVPIYHKLMDNTNWSIVVYSGLDDSIVNQAQTQSIVNNMGRPLVKNVFQAWYVPDVWNATANPPQLGGFFLQYDRISWAGVRDAGHMVPQYNPPSALELFRSYLTMGRPGRLHD
jgi:carboxypeptidase C (cathepsin A)